MTDNIAWVSDADIDIARLITEIDKIDGRTTNPTISQISLAQPRTTESQDEPPKEEIPGPGSASDVDDDSWMSTPEERLLIAIFGLEERVRVRKRNREFRQLELRLEDVTTEDLLRVARSRIDSPQLGYQRFSLDAPLESLRISPIIHYRLKTVGIRTISDLIAQSSEGLLRIGGLDRREVDLIEERLGELGLRLSPLMQMDDADDVDDVGAYDEDARPQ